MPYVDEVVREQLRVDTPQSVGELTYELQQVIEQYLEEQRLTFQTIAEIKGALISALGDFHDRMVVPYEALKCELNGDVWQPMESYQ